MSWRVPVLTYHAANVAGDAYAGNDHVALAEDLAMLARDGWRIVPARRVAEQVAGLADHDLTRCVALTCDDGTDLDVRDVDWPGVGPQRGFAGILDDAAAAFPGLAPHLTSFVIADPDARAVMDRDCLHGRGWMGEWWAAAGPRFEIGSHGWDHNHPALGEPGFDGMPRGDFFGVDTEARAEFHVARSIHYLDERIAPGRCALFAYPWGHAGDYLRREWLPRRGPELGLVGAFGVGAEPAHAGSDRWCLPRYVCGWHWREPGELAALLRTTS